MSSAILFGTAGAGIACSFFSMISCNDGVDELEPGPEEEPKQFDADCQDTVQSDEPEPQSPPQSSFKRWWFYGGIAAASILAALGVCAINRNSGKRKRGLQQQSHSTIGSAHTTRSSQRHPPEVRIPLRDVIRFKERQWFVEELEGARDGDPNAMLRLAKMYLNGQGCDTSASMAYEWLRKARALGVFATLDELYASDADTPTKRERIREMIAGEQVRRQQRRASQLQQR